jgi:hypothetical protein
MFISTHPYCGLWLIDVFFCFLDENLAHPFFFRFFFANKLRRYLQCESKSNLTNF